VEVGGHEVTWLHSHEVFFWMWDELGNPELVIEGNPYAYTGMLKERWVRLPLPDGTEFGQFFASLQENGRALCSIPIRLDRPGPVAREDYALIELKPDPEGLILAQGTVGFYRSMALADTYTELCRAEMVDPEQEQWGRGDHVGNYTTCSREFGV
jgi:hypothetical protein